MAVNGTHDTGEEFKQKSIFRTDNINRPTSITVGLYNDSTDNLSQSDDVGAITTEPTTGNYSPQTSTLDSTDITLSVSSGDLEASTTVTFDTSDTGETVDGYFVLVNFQSDIVAGESSASDHILSSATFGTTDLTNFLSLDVTVQDVLS